MFFGLIVLIVGVVFLLKNVDVIGGEIWTIIWPCLIIALGLSILFKRKKNEKRWERFGDKMQKLGEEIGKAFEGKDN